MSGQLLNVTGNPTTISAAKKQPVLEAIDLLGTPGLRYDFALRSYYVAGSSPVLTVKLLTSMYNEDNDDTWDLLGTVFSTVNASNKIRQISVTANVLRYVRWEVEVTSGSLTTFTFEVLGVAW